jgi:hypothetical protein
MRIITYHVRYKTKTNEEIQKIMFRSSSKNRLKEDFNLRYSNFIFIDAYEN